MKPSRPRYQPPILLDLTAHGQEANSMCMPGASVSGTPITCTPGVAPPNPGQTCIQGQYATLGGCNAGPVADAGLYCLTGGTKS